MLRSPAERDRAMRWMRRRPRVHGAVAALACGWIVAVCVLGACDREPSAPPKSQDTIEVEREAGDFLDYYAEVLRLAQVHSASPDSFRVALGQLPGTHLDEKQWEAWTRPYRADPRELADRLEHIIAERKTKP